MIQLYTKTATQPMTPWTPDSDMVGVSISEADRENGSPQEGDMIAYNPDYPEDRWLVAKAFFDANYAVALTPEQQVNRIVRILTDAQFGKAERSIGEVAEEIVNGG